MTGRGRAPRTNIAQNRVSANGEVIGSVTNSEGLRRSSRIQKKQGPCAVGHTPSSYSRRLRHRPVSADNSAASSATIEVNTSSDTTVIPLSRPSTVTLASRASSVEIITPRRESPASDLDPPPAQRRRVEPQPNSIEALAAELGLSVREYEDAMRAEHQIYARNQQIQHDSQVANHLAASLDESPTVIRQMLRPFAAPSTSTISSSFPSTSNAMVSSKELLPIEEEADQCVICLDDKPIDSYICRFCSKIIGCFTCVKAWFDNAPKNNQERSCPLCRHHWASLAPAKMTKKARTNLVHSQQ